MKSFLNYFNVLTETEIDDIVLLSSKRVLKKGDYFVREGEICKEVVFVLSGSLRSFYISEKGGEITYCITFPNKLMTAYSSFITGSYSTENIQAITSVELIVISKSVIDDLASKNHNWLRFLKIVAEQQYIELEKRVFQLQRDSASKRYLDLITNQPEYIQLIPLQFLASYLGVSQRHLSRIRKEISF